MFHQVHRLHLAPPFVAWGCQFLAEEDTEPAVIGFFNAETHQSDVDAFEAAAKAHKFDFRFAYSTEDDVRAHFKSSGCRVDVYKAPRFVADKYEKAKVREARGVAPSGVVLFAARAGYPDKRAVSNPKISFCITGLRRPATRARAWTGTRW
jgi:hypothetical protein